MRQKFLEIINKAHEEAQQPAFLLPYAKRDNDGSINLSKTVCIHIHSQSSSLNLMEKTSKEKDFMFFKHSEEGEKFFEENKVPIRKAAQKFIAINLASSFKEAAWQ